jgi:hypothetical protein
MAKTYIPMAVDWASSTHKRLTRYQAQLSAGLSTEQIAALTELIACLATFLSKVTKPPPNP